jgi:hypothetical protein
MGKKRKPAISVKVGPLDYTVIYAKRLHTDHELFGVTMASQQKIYVDPDVPLQTGQDTLLHELLHAIFDVAGLNIELDDGAKLTEEQIIRRVTPWLLMLLKDNPHVVEHLIK